MTRLKKEIKESPIFDRLKTEMGIKGFNLFLTQRVVPIDMDIVRD
jgi:hypothetical protein